MREIKFRGIPIYGTEFVYGYLNVYKSEKGLIYEIITNENGTTRYEIKPETVGQYIELKDKNRKEIYEGDIIKFKIKGYGVIIYCGATYSIDIGNDITDLEFYHHQNVVEVVGNIYENPELLSELSKNKREEQ